MKKIILTLSILLITSSCTRTSFEHSGNKEILKQSKIDQLIEGTPKERVIELLGAPMSESYVSGYNALSYQFSESESIIHLLSTDGSRATASLLVMLKGNEIESIIYRKDSTFKYIDKDEQDF